MRWLPALAVGLVGCTPQLHLNLTPPNPDRARWEREVSDALNDHTARLRALEAKEAPDGPE